MNFKFTPHNRKVIQLSGSDKHTLLQGLITNNVNQKGCIYTAMLTPQGRYLFDFFIYPFGEDLPHSRHPELVSGSRFLKNGILKRVQDDNCGSGCLLIDIATEQAADFTRKLQMYKLRSQVTITDVSEQYQVVLSDAPLVDPRLRGDDSRGDSSNSILPSSPRKRGSTSFQDPRLRQLGYRSILPHTSIEPHGADYYETLRITNAIPVPGKELISEKSIILECGFDELHAMDWQKGCYIGQELMARTKHRGGIHKRLYSVKFTGKTPEFMTPVMAGDKEVGTIRSTYDGLGIAMIRVEAVGELLTVNGHPCVIANATEQ